MAERKVSLNTATAEELIQLPGIGPARAERIITYRKTVHPFEEPAEIMAVSGVGERTYSAIADRLTVAPSAELSMPMVEARPEEGAEVAVPPSEEPATEEGILPQGEAAPAEEPLPEEEAPPEAEVARPEELTLEEEAAVEAELVQPEEVAEEVAPPPGEEPPEEEAAPEGEEAPAEEEPPPEVPPLPPEAPPTPVPFPSRPWWGRLSWLWSALLGGVLGMIFTLLVLSGINGALAVRHTRVVLEMDNRVDNLAAEMESARRDINGLRQRLGALEGLTARMKQVEAAVDELREETVDLGERADALEEEMEVLSKDLETISEDVAALQSRSQQVETFFQRLQALLVESFGRVAETPTPTPTPWVTPSPSATPTPSE